MVRIGFAFGFEACLAPLGETGCSSCCLRVCLRNAPDGDGGAAGGDATSSPSVELTLHSGGIWDVSLERNPRVHALQGRPVQGAHECLGCEMEVTVFLHVQVDKLWPGRPV